MRYVIFWGNQLLGVFIIVLTLSWLIQYRGFGWSTSKQFSWHPLFMILGFIYFFGNAVIIFRVFPYVKKWPLKLLHMSVHALAGLSAAFALYVIVDERNNAGKGHFLSLHSWIGIVALALFGTQWAFSVLIFLVQLTTASLQAKILAWHLRLGRLIFMLAVMAMATGLKGKTTEEQPIINVLGISIVAYALIIFYVMSRSDLKYVTNRRSSAGRGSSAPL